MQHLIDMGHRRIGFVSGISRIARPDHRPDQTPTTVTLQHRLIVRKSCGASVRDATASPAAESSS